MQQSITENIYPEQIPLTENIYPEQIPLTENIYPEQIPVTENIYPEQIPLTENISSLFFKMSGVPSFEWRDGRAGDEFLRD